MCLPASRKCNVTGALDAFCPDFRFREYESEFKFRYKHPPLAWRPPCELPPPGRIMHADMNDIKTGSSEIRSKFKPMQFPPPFPRNVKNAAIRDMLVRKKTNSNMYMDVDKSKFNSFDTTNSTSFVPITNPLPNPSAPSLMSSSIPQGDTSNAELPSSTFQESFQRTQGEPAVKFPSQHFGGPPTIAGDAKLANTFETTTHSTYKQIPFPLEANKIKFPDKGMILRGDPEREVTKFTEHQESFKAPPIAALSRSSREKINSIQSHHREGDPCLSEYITTTINDFKNALEGHEYGNKRNVSSRVYESHIPEGDLQADRVKERLNTTSSRSSYPKHAMESPVVLHHLDKLASHIQLGCDLNSYDTTSKSYGSIHVALRGKYPARADSSAIPLDYYGDSMRNCESISTSSFKRHHNLPRLTPNKKACDKLRQCSIRKPYLKDDELSTTYKDAYVPKELPEKFHLDTYKSRDLFGVL